VILVDSNCTERIFSNDGLVHSKLGNKQCSLGGLLLVVFRFDISGRHDVFRQHSLNCSAPVCLFFPFHFPK